MLSGEYNFLVDNLWLTQMIAVVLLIIPFFLIFADKKWIFGFYVVSIVANLPLIFVMAFGFSYELIIALATIIVICKDLLRNKNLLLLSTKESRAVIIALFGVLALNLLTSFANFSRNHFFERSFIYLVNIFVLLVFSYFLVNRERLQVIRYAFVIGALILVFTMLVELVYGYYYLGVYRLRPAGLLLDPNVAAFTLNLSLLLSFYRPKKTKLLTDIFFISARILIIFGIFLTVSRSGYLSTLLILALFLVYYSKGKKRYLAPTTVFVIILIYFLFFNFIQASLDTVYRMIDLQRIFPRSVPPAVPGPTPAPSISIPETIFSDSRFELLKAGIKVFLNNYILGVGIGNITGEIYNLTGMPMNTHNLVLQLLGESGIFMLGTLLIFFYYLVQLIVKSEKKQKFFLSLIFLVIVLESFFNHNLLNVNIIYLMLAFFLALNILFSREQTVLSLAKIINKKKR
ncbi:MAG TPA: O-antigen ligase family protein [Acholeplasmataceae bacterium]|jgi:O-antigen ligase|nr:O-antigen ligase family protein [Acholeplasmataceae bacterium]